MQHFRLLRLPLSLPGLMGVCLGFRHRISARNRSIPMPIFSTKSDEHCFPAGIQTGGVAKGAAFWPRESIMFAKNDLSPTQSEVLELLAKGRDIAFMVDYFCISRSTAKTHVYNIYCKLDIHSRQDLLDMIDSADADMIHAANTDVKNQTKFKRH